jgi:phosphatidate cytidylyltransferase
MLKHRIVTASILAPLIIWGVWVMPAFWFAAVWGAVIAVAAWEWSDLAGVSSPLGRAAFALSIAALMFTGPHWADYALDWLPWLATAWWLIVGAALRRYPAKLLEIRYPTGVKLGAAAFALLTAWILMVWLRTNFGATQVLYLLVLIWLADAAAYFFGKRWGVTKLLPDISPGKTVEGLYGALLAALLFAAAVGVAKGFPPLMIGDFVFLSLVTVLLSVVGDLFESLVKRVRGVKDSGALLPGHGGLLDRIDSLLAAVAVFYAGCSLREIFLQ